MAINNRDLDVGEQRHVMCANLGAVATGVTKDVFLVPYPCNLDQVKVYAAGVSNAMALQVNIHRFIIGSGATAYAGAATLLTLQNYSTSGLQSVVLASSGSTPVSLAANDIIQVVSSVANGNATDLALEVVLKATQDQKSFF